LMVKAGEWKTH